jgi:hypothetical protein
LKEFPDNKIPKGLSFHNFSFKTPVDIPASMECRTMQGFSAEISYLIKIWVLPDVIDSGLLDLDSDSDGSDFGVETLYSCSCSLQIFPPQPVVEIPVHNFSFRVGPIDLAITINKNYFYRDEYALFTLQRLSLAADESSSEASLTLNVKHCSEMQSHNDSGSSSETCNCHKDETTSIEWDQFNSTRVKFQL